MTAPVLATKRCSACGETKPLSEFHRDRGKPDGHTYRCKPCARAAKNESVERVRERIGDEEWRRRQALAVTRYRAHTGNRRGLIYTTAVGRAHRRLAEIHRTEFEHLLAVYLREVEQEREAS